MAPVLGTRDVRFPEEAEVGVGGRLMDAVEDELRRRGIDDLRLLVLAGNAEAIHPASGAE